jgi:hypothetical protein
MMMINDAESENDPSPYTKLREDFEELLHLAKELETAVAKHPDDAEEHLRLKGGIRLKFEEIHEIIDLF